MKETYAFVAEHPLCSLWLSSVAQRPPLFPDRSFRLSLYTILFSFTTQGYHGYLIQLKIINSISPKFTPLASIPTRSLPPS